MRIHTEFPKVLHRSQHLVERDLDPANAACPFCESNNRTCVFPLQTDPVISLLKCTDCHAISASRMPTDITLADYYGKYYDRYDPLDPESHITLDDPIRLAKKLCRMYRLHQNQRPVHILDFGGGDGTIAQLTAMELLKHDAGQVNITIVDFGDQSVEPQDTRIVIERVKSLSEVKHAYGFVIASAVVEHHPQPQALLKELAQCMEQRGIFYARTPTLMPIMKLLRRFGIAVDFTFPAHLHDQGQAFWEEHFKNNKFETFQVLESQPSIVETTLRKHTLRTLVAHLIKAPWHLLGRSYPYVGGWEILARKCTANTVRGR